MEHTEQWQALANMLGFRFTQKVRPFVELPSLHKLAARAARTGDLQRAERLLSHPAVASVLSRNFPGSATGVLRGWEFALFPSTYAGTPAVFPAYYANVVLVFGKDLGLGMAIRGSGAWAWILRTVGMGSLIRFPENPDLDRLVQVRAGRRDQATALLSRPPLQDALVTLYRFSHGFEISDRDIRYAERGAIFTWERAREIMDRMADAADQLAGGNPAG